VTPLPTEDTTPPVQKIYLVFMRSAPWMISLAKRSYQQRRGRLLRQMPTSYATNEKRVAKMTTLPEANDSEKESFGR
jgi:hypothetical protein